MSHGAPTKGMCACVATFLCTLRLAFAGVRLPVASVCSSPGWQVLQRRTWLPGPDFPSVLRSAPARHWTGPLPPALLLSAGWALPISPGWVPGAPSTCIPAAGRTAPPPPTRAHSPWSPASSSDGTDSEAVFPEHLTSVTAATYGEHKISLFNCLRGSVRCLQRSTQPSPPPR